MDNMDCMFNDLHVEIQEKIDLSFRFSAMIRRGIESSSESSHFFLLEVNMKKFANILGTKYTIRKVTPGQDEFMDRMQYGGYCDGISKEIVLLDIKALPDWSNEPKAVVARKERETLRREIIHAFLNESGLGWNSFPVERAWAKNEEMVDWIAIQFPKIRKVFEELGCAGE